MRLPQFLTRWFTTKAAPEGVVSGAYYAPTGGFGGGFVDAYKKQREPNARELLSQLKNTAWSCASINAAVCASMPPKLYVRVGEGLPEPKCQTKAVSPQSPLLSKTGPNVREVVDIQHPLLALIRNVNPVMNSFDLFELTQMYLEAHGCAYWLLNLNAFKVPEEIWPLPSQNVRPVRRDNSKNVVDYYEYFGNGQTVSYPAERVIEFKFVDPKDPYSKGLSPLRACYEQMALSSEYTAMRRAVYDNAGIPSAVVSPGDIIGEDEKDRLEAQWNQKFRRGGQGKVLFAESDMKVQILSHSIGDLAALAEMKATKEDIANAFHVPLSYLTGEMNLANIQAADHTHKSIAISPRLKRRDEKLNEKLIPFFDPTGRLFFASEDPVIENKQLVIEQQERDLREGIRSINEIRAERGLPPVPWGELPYPDASQMQQQQQQNTPPDSKDGDPTVQDNQARRTNRNVVNRQENAVDKPAPGESVREFRQRKRASKVQQDRNASQGDAQRTKRTS